MRPDSRTDLELLAAELKRAIIVEPDKVPHDVITMNSRAELLDLDTGETVIFTLVLLALPGVKVFRKHNAAED